MELWKLREILLEEMFKPKERELESFVSKIKIAGSNARVFIFGSIFGGTGASSIPVIPKAYKIL
ncbi:MAG: hypothetical protein IPP27_02505 [Bacteroidetes bacterium]|nr:hypothetical protein [Bacteroidota bacterium]